MKKKVSILLFVGALAIVTIFAVAHNAGANSGYRDAYDAAHGNPSGTTSCSFCHTSPPTLNATGQTLFASANPPGSTNFNYCSIGPATGTCAPTVTAPVISTFTATPASITSGSSSTLAWTLSGGAPTTLTIDNGVGSVLGTTSRSVSPTATTTYTLTASNSAGSVTRTVTVTVTAAVAAPVISSLTATPASITSGQSSTLAWTLSGGAPTTLTIDNGVGSVLGTTSRAVSPTATTTYTLTASNSAGSVTRTVTVTVTPPDGVALYASNCAGCHGPLASSAKRGRSATQIQSAINSNRGGMGSLSSLTSAQVQAIADALGQQPPAPVLTSVTVTPSTASIAPQNTLQLTASPLDQNRAAFVGATITWSSNSAAATVNATGLVTGVSAGTATITATATSSGATTKTGTSLITVTAAAPPPPAIDGAALYAANCASCHNPLATSAKKGRTATQIQNAINSVGAMSSLSTLTSAQVQAIADALGQQAPPPVLTSVTVTPPTASIASGTTLQLTASPLDQNRAAFVGATITWSSNSPVATVNATGLVTGQAAGTATITATATTSGATPKTGISLITVTAATPPPPAIDGAALYAANCSGCHGSLASSSKRGRTASQIQSAINSVGSMSSLSTLTSAQVQAIADALGQQPPPPLPLDGAALYAANCASCHGPLASSTKIGATAPMIQAAINANIGGMGSFSRLTPAQIQAIATVLGQQTPPPPLPPIPITDGPTLYGSYCGSCHGPLASSEKRGRTVSQIQNAIANNTGGMGIFSNLTYTQLQAIAAALAPDTTPPTVTAFSIPATSSSLTVSITTFTATDNVGVTGYMVTESATAPSATTAGWSATPPTSYTCSVAGAKTLYAWAKDAAGNVSASKSASVTISLSDTIPPTVTAFSIPATSSSLTVTITTFTATDNVGVTGYMVTESATAPGASAATWNATAPASYTCATAGAKTLYAWAKDAAGNVSTSRSGTLTVTAQNPSPSPSPAIDLTVWSGQWFKVNIKYTGLSFGNSNSSEDSEDLTSGQDSKIPGMSTDQQNVAVYLKLVSWDPNQGVLQGNLYQIDSASGQWVSDPLVFHLIGGKPTDFLCWTQSNGDFTSGFVVRIQGKEKGNVLTGGTIKTLGGFYFEINKGASSSSPESLAGGISISGRIVPESKVPVPK